VLSKRYVDIGDYVRIGDPVTGLVDLDPLEVTIFVNEKDVVQLEKGNEANLRFSGGETRMGKVSYIAPAGDADSRTFRIDVEMDNVENPLPAGLTAEVRIAVKTKKAHKISPAILTLDDEGQVGVKMVDQSNKVVFTPVEIIADEPSAMWITGLSDTAKIIVVGQDFVSNGQQVDPVTASQQE